MESLFFFTILLCSTALIGYLLTSIFTRFSFIERIALSFVVGSLVSTYIFFVLHTVFSIPATKFLLVITHTGLLLVLFSAMISSNSIRQNLNIPSISSIYSKIKTLKLLETLLVLSIIFLFVYTSFTNIFWPIDDWDALALYDYRALVITDFGSFLPGVERGYFLQYPPFTSLLHTFAYLANFQHPKVWYSLLYVSFILLIYSLSRRNNSRVMSLFAAFSLAISSHFFEHAQMAYTNLAYSGLVAAGYIYLIIWIKEKESSDLLIGSFLIAASTWVRLIEPFWLLSLVLIPAGVLIHRKAYLTGIATVLLVLFLKTPWTYFVAQYSVVDNTNPLSLSYGINISTDFSILVTRAIEVIIFLYSSAFVPIFHIYMPALLLSVISILIHKKWRKLVGFVVFLALILLLVVGTFVFSFQFPGWQEIPGSTTRMSMIFIPIIVYLIFQAEPITSKTNKLRQDQAENNLGKRRQMS